MALAWFPCYVNDLLGSLSWRCMTPAQRGAYWQLICCQMQAEDGTLPDGIAMLSRLADLDLSGENSVVLDKFPPTESGKRANLRAYSEWLKRQDISEKRSNAGAIGGASKKQLPEQKQSNCSSKPEADAHVLPPTTTTTSTGTETPPQEHPKHKTTRAQAPAGDDGFESFWKSYPVNRDKKAEARKSWIKLKPNAELQAKILAALDWQRKQPKWVKDNGDFVPMAVTYLNQRRWEDEPPAGTPGAPPKPKPPRMETDMDRALARMAREMVDE